MLDVILKRFDQPDETRTFSKGKFDLVHLGGMTIGRATYEPGWRWSVRCRCSRRAHALRRRTCRHGRLRESGRGHDRRAHHRDESR